MIILPVFSLYGSSSSSSSVLDALADGLDGALEAGGCLQLQLVGHGVDLEPVQPVQQGVQTHVSISSGLCSDCLTNMRKSPKEHKRYKYEQQHRTATAADWTGWGC